MKHSGHKHAVPILTYHGCNVNGHGYAVNDHVALAADLSLLRELDINIVSLRVVAEWVIGTRAELPFPCVGLSFDDGPWFDWIDLEHPSWGPTPSFRTLLMAAQQAGQGVHATSFVIVSPEARQELDRTCMVGRGWWTDDWWTQAESSGLIAIENHSWDHNHETLGTPPLAGKPAGCFDVIDTKAEADFEIAQASDYLDRFRAQPRESLLAYPYGQSSEYLLEEYLPKQQQRHRTFAAFTTAGEPVSRSSNRWCLPRYVGGWHWKTVDELRTQILHR